MSRVTIKLEAVSVSFPKTRVTLRSLERYLLGWLGASKRSDHFTALKSVSLEIQEGEVIGLVGKNGAGKSTLLRVMAGIYRPDVGTAMTRGRASLLAGLGAGFNVNLSGRENAYLYGSILGYSRELMDDLMEGIIRFSELREFIDEPLRTYSNGMRTRLAFSVASAVRPEILLIDEILGAGDADFRERSTARIREMVSEAGTVVIASHNLKMLAEVCNRAVLVKRGEIEAVGEPEEIIAMYRRRPERQLSGRVTAG